MFCKQNQSRYFSIKFSQSVSLDRMFLFQLVTFEVPHKPGYRLKMRMGIHTGSCVAGVVGTKIPHYSVFGETVEVAGIMESSGEPMRIQVTIPILILLMKLIMFITLF